MARPVTNGSADAALPRIDLVQDVGGNFLRLPAATEGSGVASSEDEDRLERLTGVCVDDVIFAFGLGEARRGRALLEAVSRIPVRRLARQVLTFDNVVGEAGLRAGGAWALKRLSRDARIEGRGDVPRVGTRRRRAGGGQAPAGRRRGSYFSRG